MIEAQVDKEAYPLSDDMKVCDIMGCWEHGGGWAQEDGCLGAGSSASAFSMIYVKNKEEQVPVSHICSPSFS